MKNQRQKRVLAVHDISSVGKCSITVALPIISAAGIECSILPTAVLSTHTGGFTNMVCQDLDNIIIPFAKHWKDEDIKFDAFYSGYLANPAQADLLIEAYSIVDEDKKALVVVDPVMGDGGKLYPQFGDDMVQSMKKLCTISDIFVPNLTEASYILGVQYPEGDLTMDHVMPMLKAFAEMGPKQIVITDISTEGDHVGSAFYDVSTGECGFVMNKRIPGYYHGTGDVFASALLSGLMNDKSLEAATRIATDFTCDSIEHTRQDGTPLRLGVRFEAELGNLASKLS